MPNDNLRPMIASRWVTQGGIRYYYRVAGPEDSHEPPLVLVHGLGVSSAYWRRIQPLLAQQRRVYALDLPGFGRTTRPAARLDTAALAQALGAWLAALDLSRVHLLGHSMGGPVAAAFAHAYPDHVARLILVGATIGVRGAKAPRQTLGLLRDALRESPSLLPVVLADYRRAGLRRVLGTERLIDDDDTIATIAQLTAPLLILRGTRDRVVSSRDTQQIVAVASHGSFVEVADAPHAVHWSRPEMVAARVNEFLASHAVTGSFNDSL